MKIVNLVSYFTIIMLTTALGAATIAIWSTNRSEFFKQRISLAHKSHKQHLQLSANTYRLFKQYGDAMLIGDRDTGESELITQIRRDLSDIRTTIGEEINLVGDEEIEELETLSTLQIRLEDLIMKFGPSRLDQEPDTVSRRWTRLSSILDDEIDRDFRSLINEALQEELKEVEQTRAASPVPSRYLLLL